MSTRDDSELARATLTGEYAGLRRAGRALRAQDLQPRPAGDRESLRRHGRRPVDLSQGVPEPAPLRHHPAVLQLDLPHRHERVPRHRPANAAGSSSSTRSGRAAQRAREQESVAREAGREVQEALLELRPEQRAVIVLRHFHGLSYQEMAEVVGVPASRPSSPVSSRRGARCAIASPAAASGADRHP